MKVLLLGTQLTSLVNFRGPLIRELVADGHEVVAVAPEPVEPWLGRLTALGARYVEAPMQRASIDPVANLRLLAWLWRMFRRERPDVLLAFQAKAVIWGVPTARLAGVPRRTAMIEGLGQGFRSDGSWRRRLLSGLLPRLYRRALADAQVVFFLNDDDVADFRDLGILRPDHDVVKLPGIGVDLRHYAPAPLPDGPPTFLMVARLLRDKGVIELAEAARLVRARRPDVRFHLLGPPDPTPAGVPVEEIRRLTDLTWLGETSDVRPVLASCHAFVLPTWYLEGLPRSILEAMATGRAIVTTTIRGARDTVDEGVNGHLVPPRDPEALAAAIVRLIEAPGAFAAMGAASRRIAEERFEVGAVNRQIREALVG